jgi:hypothetical protein
VKNNEGREYFIDFNNCEDCSWYVRSEGYLFSQQGHCVEIKVVNESKCILKKTAELII